MGDRVDKGRMEEVGKELGVEEFQEEAGEELVKVGWTRGPNGMEKSKTDADMGGLCEDRFDGFGGFGRGVENDNEGWGSGDRWWTQQ